MSDTVLVCDDEELTRWSLREHLEAEGFSTVAASNGKEAVDAVRTRAPGAVLMDLKMPVMDGLTALRQVREIDADLPVIVITAHGGVESAIEATKLGAAAYLAKPFDLREASLAVKRAIAEVRLRREVHYHRDRDRGGYGEIVGTSPAMQRVFGTLRRLEEWTSTRGSSTRRPVARASAMRSSRRVPARMPAGRTWRRGRPSREAPPENSRQRLVAATTELPPSTSMASDGRWATSTSRSVSSCLASRLAT